MKAKMTCILAAENAAAIAESLPAHFTALKCDAPEIKVLENRQQVAGVIDQADILLAQPAWVAPHLARAKKLRWLQSTFAGVEPLVADDCRTDYQLTGVKNIFGSLISEYVFSAVLAHSRHSAYYLQCQREKRWLPKPYQSLRKQTMAILGLGSIGLHLAQTAKHFGMKVIGVNRTGKPVQGIDCLVALADLNDQLHEADFVVLTLPATPATRHLVDSAFLEKLNKNAVLINVGRGALVHEYDLTAALQRGSLAGAVLDVFSTEPLAADSPLWITPNLTLTPHNAAVTFAEDIAEIFAKNYQRFILSQPLSYVIDFEQGY